MVNHRTYKMMLSGWLCYALIITVTVYDVQPGAVKLVLCGCQSVWVRGRPGRIYLRAPRGACFFFRLRLLSFVFLFCLFSTLVRTAGCLSPSPSLVLAEELHVGFFFFYFSSLAINSASFVSSVLLDDVASCRLEFCKSHFPVCAVCQSLGPGDYV